MDVPLEKISFSVTKCSIPGGVLKRKYYQTVIQSDEGRRDGVVMMGGKVAKRGRFAVGKWPGGT